jgi:uncharacterized protein (DUF433 family)
MSGRLVVAGTRIPVQMLLARAEDEPISKIAADYDLSEETIEQALRHIGLYQKAA